MIVAGMATIQGREKAAVAAVNSIIDQVDRLYLAVNSGSITQEHFYSSKVEILRPRKDLGDANKFMGIDYASDIYLSLDDDLLYPTNYVKSFDFSTPIQSHHGRKMKRHPESYYNDYHFVHHCLHQEGKHREVDFGGTGVMALRNTGLKYSYFDQKNIADIIVGLYAKENNITIQSVAHRAGYIRLSPFVDPKKTIFENRRKTNLPDRYLKKWMLA